MPRSGNVVFPVVNLVMVPFGLIFLPLGVVGVVSEKGEIRWVWALLAVSGLMMLGGVAINLVRWARSVREEDAAAKAMAEAARILSANPAARVDTPVLAHWTYEAGDWREFASREVRYRSGEAFWIAMAAILFFPPVAVWQRHAGWGEAFAVSLVVGGMLAAGRWLIAQGAYRQDMATPVGRDLPAPQGQVVITPTAVLMNGRYQVLRDRNIRFTGARVLEGERPVVLELSVEWPTRSGRASDSYRIPVPPGRESEAYAVVHALTHTPVASRGR